MKYSIRRGDSKKIAAAKNAEKTAAFACTMVQTTAQLERQAVPFSKLTVGLECGGLDALSDITANPANSEICREICDLIDLGEKSPVVPVYRLWMGQALTQSP
nr:UxaA family hydrolase [Pseudoflavonifractor sp. MCC625]